MSTINVTDLTFCYDGSYDNIFENVSFQIDTDWRLGFIGRNGRGKTTFFKLLMGEYPYSGTIKADKKFEYFPYPVQDKSKMAIEIMCDICPQTEDWEMIKETSILKINTEQLYQPFETLSNGEQTKILLAALFLNANHFLLIDEPTNHLDIAARAAVADYLKKKKGFILVSHDRDLLDTCTDHILAINKTSIEIQKGNFSSWWENKCLQDSYEKSQNDKLQKEIKHLAASAKRSAAWSDNTEKSKNGTKNSGLKLDKGYVGHKAAKMMKRSKSIESRKQTAIEEKSKLLHNVERYDSLKLAYLDYKKDLLIKADNLSLFYENKKVAANIHFTINQGDRISVNGKNGSGKSTLLKLICNQGIRYEGNLFIGSGLKISYVPQNTDFLYGKLSDYAYDKGIDESLFKAILNKLDFNKVQYEKNICDFSEGQKKKVLLAGSLCEKAHLYIWDEPLNFIDVFSRMQIEELLLSYQPTLLFVEHDYSFQNKIATKHIELK